VAHLIHGSSEQQVHHSLLSRYPQEELESISFEYTNLAEMTNKYNPKILMDGLNILDGNEIFSISYPVIGLWAFKE